MEKLKIRTHTMFGTHHSWAVTMRNLFAQFIDMGHDPYIKSINKFYMTPKAWGPYLDRDCEDADIDICYTAPLNFKTRFKKSSKLRLGIYNYETIPLPEMWNDSYKHLDYVLPSSNFSKKVFVEAGWPEEKCIVVPHGINLEEFEDDRKVDLINDRKFRFLNVSINHYRKNIDILVDAFYMAFTNDDDVCLVIKTKLSPPSPGKARQRFECDVPSMIRGVQEKYINSGRNPNSLPQIELVEERYPSMVPLYNSCDALVSASSAEGFGIPLLEGLAADMIVIAPKCTGQLDFLNENNSLLVPASIMSATPEYQYWTISKRAWTYKPEVAKLALSMQDAYKNHDSIKERFEEERLRTINEFTWENAAKKILEIK